MKLTIPQTEKAEGLVWVVYEVAWHLWDLAGEAELKIQQEQN